MSRRLLNRLFEITPSIPLLSCDEVQLNLELSVNTGWICVHLSAEVSIVYTKLRDTEHSLANSFAVLSLQVVLYNYLLLNCSFSTQVHFSFIIIL